MLKTFSGRRASQNEFELNSFVALMRARNVRSYLEIGARHGDTFHYVMTQLGPDVRGVALDLPGGLWGTLESADALRRAIADLKSKGYLADYLLANSQDAATVRALAKFGRFDCILIDGDHTYEGVSWDWDIYRGMSSLVAFHDIVGHGQKENVNGTPVEVPRFWSELSTADDHATFHEFVDQGSLMGIGVVEYPHV